ncbi:hypothetical protein [Ruegeria sp. HKCCD6109]|uniref:hypothetical protein n=1 Tax=Ruegeria sp. HKCCD6109 TaxID=2683017 RepID=UPI00149175C8|nr:hypothetical protein [Ruegeria sp. HKCCD6109]NOD65754.1 hypothetical protein [Ruegeria sp. HKCCD6109]
MALTLGLGLGLQGGSIGVSVDLPDFSVDTSTGSPVITVEGGTITVTISAPSIYAGTYNVPVADFDSADAVNLVPPVLAGVAAVGEDLTITPGLWLFEGTETATTYQNARDGTPVAAVTFPTYTVVAADAGTDVTVIETFKGVAAASNALSIPSLVSDTFTGTNGTLATAHVGESGEAWLELNGSGASNPDTSFLRDGYMVSNTTAGRARTIRADTPGTGNQRAVGVVDMVNRDVGVSNSSLMICVQPDGQGFYVPQYIVGASEWRLRRVENNSTAAELGSHADTFPEGENRRKELRREGNDIVFYLADVEVIRATDTTFMTGGAGIRQYGGDTGKENIGFWLTTFAWEALA